MIPGPDIRRCGSEKAEPQRGVDRRRCANKDAGPQKGGWGVPHRLEKETSASEDTGLRREEDCEIPHRLRVIWKMGYKQNRVNTKPKPCDMKNMKNRYSDLNLHCFNLKLPQWFTFEVLGLVEVMLVGGGPTQGQLGSLASFKPISIMGIKTFGEHRNVSRAPKQQFGGLCQNFLLFQTQHKV